VTSSITWLVTDSRRASWRRRGDPGAPAAGQLIIGVLRHFRRSLHQVGAPSSRDAPPANRPRRRRPDLGRIPDAHPRLRRIVEICDGISAETIDLLVYTALLYLLRPPYVIGQAIIFLPCGFFLLFLLSSFFLA